MIAWSNRPSRFVGHPPLNQTICGHITAVADTAGEEDAAQKYNENGVVNGPGRKPITVLTGISFPPDNTIIWTVTELIIVQPRKELSIALKNSTTGHQEFPD